MSLVRVTKLKIAVASAALIVASLLGCQAFSSNESETEEAKLIVNYLDQVLDAAHQYAVGKGHTYPSRKPGLGVTNTLAILTISRHRSCSKKKTVHG